MHEVPVMKARNLLAGMADMHVQQSHTLSFSRVCSLPANGPLHLSSSYSQLYMQQGQSSLLWD